MKYTKFIRKYIGCSKEYAKKIATDIGDIGLPELKTFLETLKNNINRYGRSEDNKKFFSKTKV